MDNLTPFTVEGPSRKLPLSTWSRQLTGQILTLPSAVHSFRVAPSVPWHCPVSQDRDSHPLRQTNLRLQNCARSFDLTTSLRLCLRLHLRSCLCLPPAPSKPKKHTPDSPALTTDRIELPTSAWTDMTSARWPVAVAEFGGGGELHISTML